MDHEQAAEIIDAVMLQELEAAGGTAPVSELAPRALCRLMETRNTTEMNELIAAWCEHLVVTGQESPGDLRAHLFRGRR
jgi:hypothetical protein